MTRDEFVGELIACAKGLWTSMWSALPDERRLRFAAIEDELGVIGRQVRVRSMQWILRTCDAHGLPCDA